MLLSMPIQYGFCFFKWIKLWKWLLGEATSIIFQITCQKKVLYFYIEIKNIFQNKISCINFHILPHLNKDGFRVSIFFSFF